jgi:hypothetical protein
MKASRQWRRRSDESIEVMKPSKWQGYLSAEGIEEMKASKQ